MKLGGLLGRSSRKKASSIIHTSTQIPQGAQVIPTSVKEEYGTVPFHVYHPNPYDAITILRRKKDAHEWLVAGWYIDTYREDGKVKGLMYRKIQSDQDKEVVTNELRKQDKEAIVRFSIE